MARIRAFGRGHDKDRHNRSRTRYTRRARAGVARIPGVNTRSTAIGLLFVAAVNVAEATDVPYLLPDDSPVAEYLTSMPRQTPAFLAGSNTRTWSWSFPFDVGG